MKKSILFSLILFLSLSFVACDNDDDNPQPQTIATAEDLSASLNEILATSNAHGFAVSVIEDNELIYQEAFGKANAEANKAYSNQTTQPIGSISKTFVAAALVKAIEQGYFTLETDINDLLPVAVVNPKQPNATIQVKHLVTHTSGLLDNYEVYFESYRILPGEDLSSPGAQLLQDLLDFEQRAPIPLEELMAAYYLEDGDGYDLDNFAATAPGSTWSYSNLATTLTGFLIESATGVPFKDYVQSHILDPLNMDQTSYLAQGLTPSRNATLYWDKTTPLPLYSTDSYPDSEINTSNEDLAKYLMDMMKGAKGQSTTLFSKAGYELLFEPQTANGIVPSVLAEHHGIFWFLDGDQIRHDGADPGTTCDLRFDKSGQSGYLLLTNMDASTDEHQQDWDQLFPKIQQAITTFLQNN
ncbi:MAG: serine hydrolase domain-containing protein [Bacteroidota bacterium]